MPDDDTRPPTVPFADWEPPVPPEAIDADPDAVDAWEQDLADAVTSLLAEAELTGGTPDPDAAAAAALAAMRPRPWRPDDDQAADWCARKYLDAEAELRDVEDRIAEEMARLQRWADTLRARPTSTALRMRGFLVDYLRRRKRDAGVSRVVLPTVILSYRGSQVVEVGDQDAYMQWAEADPSRAVFIRRPDPTPAISDLKKALAKAKDGTLLPMLAADQGDGETVPGILIVKRDNPQITPT